VVLFISCEVADVVQSLSNVAPRVPKIIQGGMGIRISNWKLAREVARKGELGVISGTVMDTVMIRTLQDGDPDGSIRRALAAFPDQDMAKRALDKYFVEGGKGPDKPYKSLQMWTLNPTQPLLEACVLGNFCEVWLAKHNDDSTPIEGAIVGINRLTKVPLPTCASLYGAMLADVDYVIMGAGIPLTVPGVLDCFADGNKDVSFGVSVAGSKEEYSTKFSPKEFWTNSGKPELVNELKLNRPNFVPIVSSVVLAQSMLKRANGKGPNSGIDGFVIELPTAGGHNAPPRGFAYDPVAKSHAVDLNERGEPVYGPKDEVNLLKFLKASKGLPFWLAGSYAHAEKFLDVIELGGAGVQVGSMFALAKESGMEQSVKENILRRLADGETLDVFTDPVASPTGFPFKVLELKDTLSEKDNYENRPRICSLGYLRTPYIKDGEEGKIGYRCPAEPVDDWVKKGGSIEATVGRKCLCNALCANIGQPQYRKNQLINEETGKKDLPYIEGTLITIGDEVNLAKRFIKQDAVTGAWSYSAADVVDYLKSEWEKSEAQHLVHNEVEETLAKEKAEQEKKSADFVDKMS
jgi:nitronate monooxygenase